MADSLAVRYRPKVFEDVVSQKSILRILKRQVELENFQHVYLFCGPSGCGKTTIARILAREINHNTGSPIEIDAASNNGVTSVRNIINTAGERSLDSKYKVFIIDECHSLTNQSWQALLKCIEEPPEYTIFIFCTTDPQKIPDTIVNRCMRFNFTRISSSNIRNRLEMICKQENFTNYEETIDYISKICKGQMRDAISYLEKVSSYCSSLNINDAIIALGNYSYRTFFDLLNSIIDGDEKNVLNIVNNFYLDGGDLRQFVDQFLNFTLDVMKYCLFHSCDIIQIPVSMEEDLKRCSSFDGNVKYYSYVTDSLLNLKNVLKTDVSPKNTIEVMLIKITQLK